jgi:hypothetical protein
VAKALESIAKEIKIVALPDLPEKGDVVDFIAMRGPKAAQDLLELIQAAPVWQGDGRKPPW